jgi:hypothetical protein
MNAPEPIMIGNAARGSIAGRADICGAGSDRAIHGEQFEIVPKSAPEFSWTIGQLSTAAACVTFITHHSLQTGREDCRVGSLVR